MDLVVVVVVVVARLVTLKQVSPTTTKTLDSAIVRIANEPAIVLSQLLSVFVMVFVVVVTVVVILFAGVFSLYLSVCFY